MFISNKNQAYKLIKLVEFEKILSLIDEVSTNYKNGDINTTLKCINLIDKWIKICPVDVDIKRQEIYFSKLEKLNNELLEWLSFLEKENIKKIKR